MPEFLFSTSQLYLSESQHLEAYIEEVLINPNKDEVTQFIVILTVIILLIILVKLYLNGNDNFWPDRGVPLVRACSSSTTSSILDQLLGGHKGLKDLDIGVYRKLENKKFAGLMEAQRPVFFVKDVHLAKRILYEDFDHFVNRQKFMLEKTDLLIMEMLSKLTGPKWKEMRTAAEETRDLATSSSSSCTARSSSVSSTTTPVEEEHLCRKMFSHFNSSGAQLVEHVRRESEKVENHTDGISVTECFGRFTMDVIATACLGVESSCLNEKESPFYKYGKMFQSLGPWRMAKLFIAFLFPRVAALFRISFIEQESRNFFKNIVEHTINHRKNNEKVYSTGTAAVAAVVVVVEEAERKKRNGSPRQDFLQLLLDTRDKEMKIDEAELKHSLMTGATLPPPKTEEEEGCNNEKNTKTTNAATIATTSTTTTAFPSQAVFSTHDNDDGRSNAENKLYLTDELILAQRRRKSVLLSFLAEFDTAAASSLLSFATYNLAVHPECQEKLYSEINQCLQQRSSSSNGRKGKAAALDYNAVNSMEYMDMFINETLRMFPPVSRVELRCTKEYQVDGDADTNLRLPQETLVVIPIIAYHHDERYFSDPDKFIAERFSPENRGKLYPYYFNPFGYGPQSPKNRIGIELVVVGAKTALIHLVRNFIIEPTASTPIPMEYDNFAPLLKPVRMMKIRFRPRK